MTQSMHHPIDGDPRAVLDDAIDLHRTRRAVRGALFDVPVEPTRVGRFVVRRRIGAGAMGRVYEAWDHTLDRPVALKLIAVDVEDVEITETRRARLLQEAKALAKTNHPNIIEIYEVGTVDQDVFIAMEFVPGRDLRAWLDERPRSWPEVRDVFSAAGQGLRAAHRAGLVHRDFKPENVLVGDDGRVRVVDFGLATSPGASNPAELTSAPGSGSTSTTAGPAAGTPAYMAPEQTKGGIVDARSDQFGFCVSLWEALYGARPFAVPSYERIETPPLRVAGSIPGRVLEAIETGLSLDPQRRFASMDPLLEALSHDPSQRRTRVAALSMTGVAVVAAAVATASYLRDEPDPCREVSERFEAVWGEARKLEIGQAFASTDVAYAPDVLERVTAQLDVHARRWVEAKLDACRRGRGAVDASGRRLEMTTNACLEERRFELEAVLEELSHADAKVVEHAPKLVASLQPVATCSDPEALLARPELPDDTVVEQVDAVRRELATAAARAHTGHFEESLAIAERAVTAADASRHPAVQAEARQRVGAVLGELGRNDEAQRILLEGLELAEAAAHDQTKLAIWLDLADVALRREDAATAELYVRNATGTARRLGSTGRWEANVGRRRSRLRMLKDDHAGALVELEGVLASLGDDGPPITVAGAEIERGNALHRLGRYAEADEAYRRGLALLERSVGSDHSHLARPLTNLGANAIRLGDPKRAVEPLERALDIRRRTLGGDSTALVSTLNALASAHYSTGDYVAALPLYEEALALERRRGGPDSARLVAPLTNLGRTLTLLGRYDEARTALQQALELGVAIHGQEHSQVAEIHAALAFALRRGGDRSTAREHARRAWEIRAATLGDEHVVTLQSRAALAELLLDLGEPKAADEHVDAALAGLRTQLGDAHPQVASTLVTAASVDLALGRTASAQARATEAVALLGTDAGHPEDRARARMALARAHLASGDHEAARALGREALALLRGQAGAEERARTIEEEIARW